VSYRDDDFDIGQFTKDVEVNVPDLDLTPDMEDDFNCPMPGEEEKYGD
jgi:hypothetical protein